MNNIFTDTNGDNDILIHNLNKDNILIILKYLFILIKIYLFYVMIQLNFQILVQQKVLMIY